MAPNDSILKLGLGVTAVVGLLGTWGLAMRNGTMDILARELAKETPLLPYERHPMTKTFTGITAVDGQLTTLLQFFWPVVGGGAPAVSLFSGELLAGQYPAIYILLLIESLRTRNQGRLITYVTVWGMLFQNIAFAATIPFCFLLDLTLHGPGSSKAAPTYEIEDIGKIRTMPMTVFLCYAVPAVVALMPTPFPLSISEKELWVVIWQFFPILILICQTILTRTPLNSGTEKSDSEKKTPDSLVELRIVYILGIALAATSHIVTLLISLTSLVFTPTKTWLEFHPMLVFVPQFLFSNVQVTDFSRGVLYFLQYDCYAGSMALGLWVAATLLNTNVKGYTPPSWPSTLYKFLLGWLAIGPGGAALALLWKRDEEIWKLQKK